MRTDIRGRHQPRELLQKLLKSKNAELLAVHGRRRIGKTYLIKHFFEEEMVFQLTGMHEAPLKEQLKNFGFALAQAQGSSQINTPPESWQDAFQILINYLKTFPKTRKIVVFFDELPWLASKRSRFLPALDHFWNSWAANQRHLIVVICGSAAAWMIKKVIHDRGGLHNRVTRTIRLLPFSLGETAEFLAEERGVNLDNRQLIQIYMTMGGVPLYLREIEPGLSAAQNVESICFTRNGLLWDEFNKLYHSLFSPSGHHIAIVEALAKKRSGLTRLDLIEALGVSDNGFFSDTLEELEESGFLMRSHPFGKVKKDALYFLADEYSMFYLTWIRKRRGIPLKPGDWLTMQTGQSWKSWTGFAFETLCLKHIPQLKKALGISGVRTEEASWLYRPKPKDGEKGAQIDLLVDRQDNCINLCEMKFYDGPFTVSKAYAEELRRKQRVFREVTKSRKTLFPTLVTVEGVKQNAHSREVVTHEIEASVLFER